MWLVYKVQEGAAAEEESEEIDTEQNTPSVSSEGGHFVLDLEGSYRGLLSKEWYGYLGILQRC